MSPHRLALRSISRSNDANHLAASDMAAFCARAGVDYRLVGGVAVGLLTWVHGVNDLVPDRETADADLGAEQLVVGDARLLTAVIDQGYHQVEGNRFTRTVESEGNDLLLTIDVLAPSYGPTMESNSVHGSLVVDLVPGLGLVLARPATPVTVEVDLLEGKRLTYSAPVPDVVSMLCMKAYAYGSRFDERDAVDVWRLLEAVNATGFVSDDWPKGASAQRAAEILIRFFAPANSSGVNAAASDRPTRTRIRSLIRRIVPGAI